MTGLSLMNRLMDPAERDAVLASHTFTEAPAAVEAPAEPLGPVTTRRSRKVRTDLPIPPAPYLDRRVRDVPNLAEVWSYINPFMIYGRHLGYKGNFEKALAEHEEKALELFHNVEEVKHEAARFMKVKRRVAVLRSRARRQRHPPVRAGRRRRPFTPSTSAVSAAKTACASATTSWMARRHARSPRADGGDRRRVHPRKERGVEKGRRVLQGPRHTGAGHRNRRSHRRVAAPPHPRRLGLPRPAHRDHARSLHLASITASATASAIPPAPTWTISRASGNCSSPKTSACT